MRTFKTRHQFYLPDDLSEQLERLGAAPGSSKTAILTGALRAWIDRGASHELDERFARRLDRLSREHRRIERRLDVLAEALGLFIQHQLTIVANQPPFDADTARLGLERYRAFVDLAARRLARGDGSLKLVPREEAENG
jgi:predicted transcriptional regulator